MAFTPDVRSEVTKYWRASILFNSEEEAQAFIDMTEEWYKVYHSHEHEIKRRGNQVLMAANFSTGLRVMCSRAIFHFSAIEFNVRPTTSTAL